MKFRGGGETSGDVPRLRGGGAGCLFSLRTPLLVMSDRSRAAREQEEPLFELGEAFQNFDEGLSSFPTFAGGLTRGEKLRDQRCARNRNAM